MFLALKMDFLAGRLDTRLKSTNKRRLTVLELALHPVSVTIEVEDNVGFLTAARRILRSVKGDVTRGRPERFLGLSEFFSAIRFNVYPTVLLDTFIMSEIRLIEYFCSLSILICAHCARDNSRVVGITMSLNSEK